MRVMKIWMTGCALVAVMFLGMTVSANAETITGVTIEDVSSEIDFWSGELHYQRLADFVLDGSGFDEVNGYHTNTVEPNMWLTNGLWQEPHDLLPAHITFDLEGNYVLSSFKVWNYNEGYPPEYVLHTECGVKDVEILVASSVGGAFTSLGSFVFNQAPGYGNVDFGQTIDLSGFVAADDVRLVKFDISSNWDTTGVGGEHAGLSEVRFDGAVVPEPSTVTLVLTGLFGLLAYAWRKRK